MYRGPSRGPYIGTIYPTLLGVDSQFWQFRGRPVCPVVIRVGFVLFWKFLYKPTWRGVRLPRPINIKAKADWGIPNRINQNIALLFISQTLDCFLPSSRRHLKMFWVACRPQSNPSRVSSDGVPPELAFLGLRGALLHTGQTGLWNRSDRSAGASLVQIVLTISCAF